MIRLDRTPREPLPATAERKVVRELERLARGAGAVLASDYGSGTAGRR